MTSKTENIQPLEIKDCNVLNIATGVRAQNLRELSDALVNIHPGCITYHFWAKKLRPTFEEPEYNNDFATWAYNNLHNNKLAERLSLINPGKFSDTEDLRKKLIKVTNLSLEEDKSPESSKESEKFQFTRSEIVLFDKGITINTPEELVGLINELSLGSIYYHLIDSNEISSNITSWLLQFGDKYKSLTEQIASLDPYFYTLDELRTRVSKIFKDYFEGASN